MTEDYGPFDWAEEMDITDLNEDVRQAYQHAYGARLHLNHISDDLDRYSKAALEERIEIEDELHPRLYALHEDLSAADELLGKDRDENLSEDDYAVLGAIAPYQHTTKDKLSELGEKISQELSKDLHPGDISPMARGNYEETMEYVQELEQEFEDNKSRLEALMSTL